MRPAGEFRFRIHQEIVNLAMRFFPPSPQLDTGLPLPVLPAPAEIASRLQGSDHANEIIQLAGAILDHRFPLLGVEIATGPEISWRRDYQAGLETAPLYFRRIPYLDATRAGDHKIIWELNRHAHLAILAQAFLICGDRRFLEEIQSQWEHWERENPFQCGINWASALEVAFRSLAWIFIFHVSGHEWDSEFRRRFLTSLYRHGCYLENNLSIYFSPNTHLLGEAVALHAMGVLFPAWPRSSAWTKLGQRLVLEQMEKQFHPDGSHFEHSSYYHLYCVDVFLFYDTLSPGGTHFRAKLIRMAEFLRALHTPAGTLPFLGDDDGGRLWHPYGSRERFGRATLAACAARLQRPDLRLPGDRHDAELCWWLDDPVPEAMAPPADSLLFRDVGLAVMRYSNAGKDVHITVDAGPFGAMKAGHSHSDTLSVLVFAAGQELLIDPGTYTYVHSPEWRARFRGSAAHNTVRLDGLDQAIPAGPFAWRDTPRVELLAWSPGSSFDELRAACSYRGFRHYRTVRFIKPDRLWILDRIEGPPGEHGVEHGVEQFWHPGVSLEPIAPNCFALGTAATLWLPEGATADVSNGGEYGWRSAAPGEKHPAFVLRVHCRTSLPVRLGAVLDWRPAHLRTSLDPADALFLERLNLDPG